MAHTINLSGIALSDELPELYEQLDHFGNFKAILPKPPEIPTVVDANAVVQALAQRVRYHNQRRAMLEECARSQVLKLHAPSILEQELVYSAIPKLARNMDLDEGALLQAWDEFKPLLTFHDVPQHQTCYHSGSKYEYDEQYCILERTIQAVGIVSDDKDIEKLDGNRLNHSFLKHARFHARASADTIKISIYGLTVSGLTINLGSAAIRGLVSLWRLIPDILKIGLGLLLLIILRNERVRKTLHSKGQTLGDVGIEVLDLIFSLYEQFQEIRNNAYESLDSIERQARKGNNRHSPADISP